MRKNLWWDLFKSTSLERVIHPVRIFFSAEVKCSSQKLGKLWSHFIKNWIWFDLRKLKLLKVWKSRGKKLISFCNFSYLTFFLSFSAIHSWGLIVETYWHNIQAKLNLCHSQSVCTTWNLMSCCTSTSFNNPPTGKKTNS